MYYKGEREVRISGGRVIEYWVMLRKEGDGLRWGGGVEVVRRKEKIGRRVRREGIRK